MTQCISNSASGKTPFPDPKLRHARNPGRAICAIFCLVTGLLTALYLHGAYKTDIKGAEMRVTNTSLLVTEWIKGAFAQSDYVLRDIVGLVESTDMVRPDPGSVRHRELSRRIEAKRNTLPHTLRIGLFKGNCTITHLPTHAQHIGMDVSQREYCRALREAPAMTTYVTHAYLGRVDSSLHVVQVRRLMDERGAIEGFAGIAVELSLFDGLLNTIAIPDGGVISIIDTNGTLLARRPADDGKIGKPAQSEWLAKFLSDNRTFTLLTATSPLDQKERILGVRVAGDLPFVVVVGEAKADILHGWYIQACGALTACLLLWGMALTILHHYQRILADRQIIEHQATHDALTGIPTLRLIEDRLRMACSHAKRSQKKVAILFIDLDGFKVVNDKYGHEAGDHVLVVVADRIRKSLRDSDTAGRKGGDEFIVILDGIDGAEHARTVANKLIQVIDEPIDFRSQTIMVGASIGIGIYPEHDKDPEVVMRLADHAMYASKQAGKNRVHVHDRGLASNN